jgi:hypothetical protein
MMGTMETRQTTQTHSLEEAMLHQDLATFAARFAISPAQAFVLPALFERVAQMAGRSTRQMVVDATYNNRELGEYLASVAKEVAAKAA